MKLLRIKITDPKGFRSLQAGFEYQFRTEWDLQEENGFAPFVCAGPNGSGKSNLLEALAAIFYHMECIYLENRPDSFDYDEETNPNGFQGKKSIPEEFEIEYLIDAGNTLQNQNEQSFAHILVVKEPENSPKWFHLNAEGHEGNSEITERTVFRELLPKYILGYSSGENEILSLPFFKMRFIQYDEYWQALKEQSGYSGSPESRLIYLDSGFSQAILLCNLLFQEADALKPFREDVKVEELREFRIIIRSSIEISKESASSFFGKSLFLHPFGKGGFQSKNPAVHFDPETERYTINLITLLDGSDKAEKDKIIPRLNRCATCWYHDESSDTIYLDYFVNEETRQAFRDNFSNDPIQLFQAFQVLLTLNLYSVSDRLKADLYQSESHYVSETVPTLASDERIMRFKFVKFSKTDVAEPVMLKNLSDGEHQLLHALGLCLLFRNTQSLFLLDEPETHFNPDWRANFISRLSECFNDSDGQEMLITTHTPFLISDSKPEKVLVFKKSDGVVSVEHPDYNTLGASINKITMATFGKRETIGLRAQTMLENLRQRFEQGANKEQLLTEINRQIGDSVEKVLLIKTILDSMEEKG
ncbi:MAG: restriction system-associated AAA family ATPase [Chlorobium limicola]|uniref:restriction system-associated AAA family ATPase n=1 Tax=Chlorobium limicola TaxID=1092 RepID=UPI0023F24FB4|nr:restriction system-associated AAA family ATPase [Chlorobium limicola]NTV21523.1 restriction system-associated AAA family ATPase [Chlorobium limicola]